MRTADKHKAPGDLGRRIAFRRRELGLTREQVAARTGMAPEYLDYVERYHATVTAETLLSLAVALDTTVDVLLGTTVERPPGGPGRNAGEPRFRRLEAGECMRLLADGGIGRVVYVSEYGPEAIPVNFTMYEGAVVIRTAEDSVLAGQLGRQVAFEVDALDETLHQGWSVLLHGPARRIANPAVVSRVQAVLEPWAGEEERHLYVMIDPSRIGGRRIDR